MFLLFMKSPDYTTLLYQLMLSKITLRKCGEKFLQDSVFYNVFQNILYNTFGVTKKGAVLGHIFDPFLVSVSLKFAPLLLVCIEVFCCCCCVFCLYYKFLKSIYFKPFHRLNMHTGANVFYMLMIACHFPLELKQWL